MIGRGSPVTSDDFRNLVVKRRDSCVSFKDNQPSRDRQEALRFYRGDHFGMERFYGDSGDGRSTVVSRDTMEAIEGMLPALVRPFVAGDQVVSYEPTGPEDEDGAKQAADYDNYVFTTHNNAFRVIYDSMKDGLMFRLGVAKTVMEEKGVNFTYKFGTMIEIPRAAVTAGEIAGLAEFFSFGTNDLTQMTWGFSRDDVEASFFSTYLDSGIFDVSPFESLDTLGVGTLVRIGVEKGRSARPDLHIGVCGEHGGDPDSIHFFDEVGLDYVSCSPFRVPVARLEAGRSALER